MKGDEVQESGYCFCRSEKSGDGDAVRVRSQQQEGAMTDMGREVAEIKARLERIESRLGFLFRRLMITEEDAPAGKASPAVLELAARGDKIAAIRAFVGETGASLKDAKNFIEALDIGIKS